MADGRISQLGKLEMLNGNNYSIWAVRMKALLKTKGLYKLIIEKNPPPVCTDLKTVEGKTYEIWEEKNDEALGIIILSLSGSLVGMFTQDNNAKDVWIKLENMYAGNKKDRIIDCSLELKELKMHENETVDNYITRARNIISKKESLGGEIEMREVVFFIVRGLNSKLENLALILRTRRDMTIDEVHQALREEEIRMERQKQTEWPHEKALTIRERGNAHQINRDPIKTCYICKKRGHTAKNCWHRVDQKTQQQHDHPGDSGNMKYNTNKHKYNAQIAKNTNAKTNKAATNTTNNNKTTDHAMAGILQLNTNSMEQPTENDMTTWNLDSGCSIHMTSDINNLTNVVEYQSTIGMAEADRSIEATAKGQMRMDLIVNNKRVRVKMENILYVPKLRDNLLSVKELVRRGNTITFNDEGAIITGRNGLTIAKAKEENNMYTIRGNIIKDDNAYSGINEGENNQKIWHRRLGHLNMNYMNEMHKNNMMHGLTLKGKHIDMECEECTQGKLTQKPFKDHSKWTTTTRQLESIHIDLCGPLPTKSIGGNQYIFVLVDAHTKMIFVEMLKTKDEVYETFKSFKKQKENETGLKICRVRSDNGGEFVNKRLEDLFNREGIKHEKIVPYSPQSNGLAERTNRTLLDTARTMLIDAKLPGSFWGEAVSTAAYLRNRSYRKRLYNKTPIEMWNNRKPSANHLKIFGSLAYCWMPKPLRNKLQPRAIAGIMVGYSRQRKAYRIFIPSTNEVKETRNVQFYENKCGTEHLRMPDHMKQNDQKDIEEIEYTFENRRYQNNEIEHNEIEHKENREEESQSRLQSDEDESEDEHDMDPNHQTENEASHETPQTEEENKQQTPKRKGRPFGTYKGVAEKRQQENNTEAETNLKQRQVRRSERIQEKSSKAKIEETNHNTIIPNSYKEAMQTKERDDWNKAMQDELQSLNEHEVWDIVNRTGDMKVLKNRWIYTIKRDSNGKIVRYKARLVVKGNTQKKGIDYEETYAPVIKTESLRLLIALTARNNLHMTKFDIKTAYLYGSLKEETYMELPEEKDRNQDKVCKLKKSLYGLPQSGRNWNIKLNDTLNRLGFQRLKCDPSIYIKRKSLNEYTIIGTYVDDCMLIGTSEKCIEETMRDLKQEFQMREEPGDGNFLGIEIQKVNTGYAINQTNQIRKLLRKWKMEDCNPTKTPAECNTKLEEYQDSPKIDVQEYQELVGSLSYISSGSRPDIAFIVNKLSQFAKDPRAIHMAAGKRVLRYLKGTADLKIWYRRDNGKLSASSDASWSSTYESRSQSGYFVRLGDNLITWKAKKQDLVALSTCEAEINAICETVKELEWMDNVITELGMNDLIEKPTKIETDSQSAVEWASGQSVKQRTKHFSRKYYKIREEVERNNIILKHKPGRDLEADLFTKGMTEEKLKRVLRTLGVK